MFHTLLTELEHEREALGGQVFDVLGNVFSERPLRDLLIEAIRYGDRLDVRAHLQQVVDQEMDRAHLQALIEEQALARDTLRVDTVQAIREDMERHQARRRQPHYIAAFFREAFRRLGGTIREPETGLYEITHAPGSVRNRDRLIGPGRQCWGVTSR